MILSNLHNDVSRDGCDHVRCVEGLAPEVPRNHWWQKEAADRHHDEEISEEPGNSKLSQTHQKKFLLVLESKKRIRF